MAQTKERRKKFKNISFEIPMEQYEELQQLLKRNGLTVSGFMREALNRHTKEVSNR